MTTGETQNEDNHNSGWNFANCQIARSADYLVADCGVLDVSFVGAMVP